MEISVVENFLCDAVGSDPKDENTLLEILEKVINEFAVVIGSVAKSFLGTKFAIVIIFTKKILFFNHVLF